MEKKSLKGRVALITGASQGIGESLALVLAENGANVALLARNKTKLEVVAKKVESYGVKSWVYVADVTKEDEVLEVKKQWKKEGMCLDILINNAGVGKYGNILSFSVDDYDWVMDSNMKSSFIVTKTFLPLMLEAGKGNIVFIASAAGLKAPAGEAIYGASKSAQISFAQSLDAEVRKKGIKVNIVATGAVNTTFAMKHGRKEGDSFSDKMLDVRDIAKAVLFVLCQSEKSRVFMVGLKSIAEPL